MKINKIYPQHGNPDVIAHGGYTKTLIDAVKEYDISMLSNVHKGDYLEMPIEEFMPNALAKHDVSIWEPYLQIHINHPNLLHVRPRRAAARGVHPCRVAFVRCQSGGFVSAAT